MRNQGRGVAHTDCQQSVRTHRQSSCEAAAKAELAKRGYSMLHKHFNFKIIKPARERGHSAPDTDMQLKRPVQRAPRAFV